MSLLVIAAVTLAIGLSVSSLSIAESQAGLIREKTGESFQVAEGCIEEAIVRLKRNPSYSGGTLSLGNGSCSIRVVPAGGGRRTITADAQVGSYRRMIESQITTGVVPTVEFWREVVPAVPVPAP